MDTASTSNDYELGSDGSELYTVKSIPGKGQGMLALWFIEQGTRILEEDVLFSIPEGLSEEQKEESVTSAYDGLPEDKKMAFLRLCDPETSSSPIDLLSKYRANAFEISTWADNLRPIVSYVVCSQASRINHSCTPNSYLDLNTNINRVTLHATVDIPKGQEITVSYCLPYYSRAVRFRDLAHYDFYCHCIVCRPTMVGRVREAQRDLMQETWFTLYNKNGDEIWDESQDPLTGVLDMIRLLTTDKLNVGALSVLYQRAVKFLVERGDRERALGFAYKKFKTEMDRLGSDSPLTQETRRYISELKSPPAIHSQLP